MLPFKKIVKWDISAIVSLILINFGTTITPTAIPGQCIHKGMSTQKVSISFYLLPQNSAKSANERLDAKCVKYSNFYNTFAMVWQILMKFRMAKHICLPKLTSDHKFDYFKIEVDRRWPTRKLRKISISFYSLPRNSEKVQITVFMPNSEIFKLLRFLYRRFTNFDEILHDDTY